MIGNSQVVVSATSGTFNGNSVLGDLSTGTFIQCPAGTKLLGGGALIAQGANAKAAVSLSAPNPASAGTSGGWQVQAIQVTVPTANGNRPSIQAYAVCTT